MSWRWAYLRFTQTFIHCKLAPLNFPHRRFNGLYKEEALNWLITKENTTKKTVLPHLLGIWLWRHIEHPSTPKRTLRSLLLLSGLISTLCLLNLVELTSGRWKMQISAPSHSETISTLFFMLILLPFNARIFFFSVYWQGSFYPIDCNILVI